MAGATLFTLIDDIATLLDDIAVMTKMAVKDTAGVLGDDLALNAHQISGVESNRELPVVWRVAKGSLVNKSILVPMALGISALQQWLQVPWIITSLLMMGGLYLCFEGVEKLVHKWLYSHEERVEPGQRVAAVANPQVDMVDFEKEKVRGAIRTDFVLSAEIIVISLGAVAKEPFVTQVGTLVAIALIMTAGVYGLVGGIVKLDDLGIALMRKPGVSVWRRSVRGLGRGLIWISPYLLRFLSIAGTIAMFLVGGHIIAQAIQPIHHWTQHVAEQVASVPAVGGLLHGVVPMLLDILIGLVAGAIVLLFVQLAKRDVTKKA